MRTPNDEQRNAIKCRGNVLLSAGAGSGKTYVLVEHVVFLATEFIIDKKQYSDWNDFSHKIKRYFAGIVLITFTRKSTSEIRLRMKKRMEEKAMEKGAEKLAWEKVLDALPLLTISTIHGFCSLLLRQGFFPGFGSGFEIMNAIETRKKIEKLFVEWFDIGKENEKDYEVVAANKNAIVNGLVKIFNDPVLRNAWKNFTVKDVSLHSFVNEYLSITGIDEVFKKRMTVTIEGKPKKWELLLNDFCELSNDYGLGTIDGIEAYSQLLNSYRMPSSVGEEFKETIKKIKQLKEFLKNYKDDLIAFEKHGNEMKQWTGLFRDIFEYIEKHYRREPKMSYSDLEYYCFEGLTKDKKIAENIHQSYQYIIVDEFQDTSHIQFEIIKRIVKGDYTRLFCVGDEKQAIYGFRGGEIGVFEECRERVTNNLELAFNYRSERTVVEFNNRFFSALLDCGDSFGNIDVGENRVCQKTGREGDNGLVLRREIVTSDKDADVEIVEARKIFDLICEMKNSGETKEIAILYRKLAPSKILMESLIQKKIPFVAQVKIPYGEDVIIGLCMTLLEFCLAYEQGKKTLEKLIDYPKFMVLSYLNLMGLSEPADVVSLLDKFLVSVRLYGFESAFHRFIYNLGISNSNYSHNIKFIKDLYGMYGEDWEGVYGALKRSSGQKYSMDIHFGERSENEMKIFIMTVHASKGLEFENVILGGINSVGKGSGEDNYIGRHPAAIKWKASPAQKKPFRSPELILEKYFSLQKDFAESKRLFYVACTRAVRGLYWMEVLVDKKKVNEKSWVAPLRRWCGMGLANDINYKEESLEDEGGDGRAVASSAIWGVVEKGVEKSSAILSEISVSGFVSVTQCPRKFYLQNICRFPKESIFSHSDGEGPVSSAARGVALHEKISTMIRERDSEIQGDEEILAWVRVALEPFYQRGAEVFSEIPVKFSLGGQVVSGTADLVTFERSKGQLEVWDFKTGRPDEAYWFQLLCYAYGFALKYALADGNPIGMAIAYLDKKNIIKKTMSFSQIQEEIRRAREKMEHLNQVNKEHCPSCSYRHLCWPEGQTPKI